MKNLLKAKYHLIFAALAQIVIIAVNLGNLVARNYKINSTTVKYDLFLIVIPSFFYTILTIAFYYVYKQNNKMEKQHKEKRGSVLFNTIIIANLIYYVVLVLNSNVGLYIYNLIIMVWNLFSNTKLNLINIIVASENTNGLYYIDTVIIQVINAFFASKFILFDAEPFTTGKEFVILKVFVYASVIATILSFYYCFDNIFMAWIFIIISAILLFITYSIYHTHFMRNLSRRNSRQ